jgi:hypothetical protein
MCHAPSRISGGVAAKRQMAGAHEQQHGEPAAVDRDDQQPGRPLGAGGEAGVERGDRARVVDVEVFGHGVKRDEVRRRRERRQADECVDAAHARCARRCFAGGGRHLGGIDGAAPFER